MNRIFLVACLIVALLMGGAASADPARDAILAELAKAAKNDDPSFAAFSAEAGKAFWFATHSGGKPDTPSCTACHTQDPKASGKTRAGKAIEPMAVSVTSRRFTDATEMEKWFLRNCNSVLGRECSPTEKGNVITYLSSQ
jgi:Domain of unknown function (DUF1924)